MSNAQRAVSLREVRERLGVSKTTLYRMVRRGDLTLRKMGGLTVVLSSELDHFLERLEPVVSKPDARELNRRAREAAKKGSVH